MSLKDDLIAEINKNIPVGVTDGVTAKNLKAVLSDMTTKMIGYTDGALKAYQNAVALWSSANVSSSGLLVVEDPSLGWKLTNIYHSLKQLDVLMGDLNEVYATRLRTGREYRVNLIEKEGGDNLYNIYIGESGDSSLEGAGGEHDQFELYKKLV